MDVSIDHCFFVALLALVYCVEGVIKREPASHMKFTVDHKEVTKGDNVTLKCWIPDKHQLDFIRIIRKNKGLKNIHISDNRIIRKLRGTVRYKGSFKREGKSAQVTLQITDVQGEDSGIYECKWYRYRKHQSVDVQLTVFVPPKSVMIKELPIANVNSIARVSDDDTNVHLYEGLRSGFQCVIDLQGSILDPEQIQFKIGNKDLKSLPQTSFEKHGPERRVVNGLVKIKHRLVWKYRTSEPDSSISGKNVTCSVKARRVPLVTTRVGLSVYYKAEFVDLHCKTQQWPVASMNISIQCRVKANPAPTAQWTWSTDNMLDGTGRTSRKDINGTVWAFQQPLGGETYEFTLVMSKLQEESYQDYNITVTNSMGSVIKTITLTTKPEVALKKFGAEGLISKSSMQVENTSGASWCANSLLLGFIIFSFNFVW